MIDDDSLWQDMKPQKSVEFLHNKSRILSTEIITAIAILGNATSKEISTFVLQEKSRTNTPVKPSKIRKYGNSVNNRLRTRAKGKFGLVEQRFVIESGLSDTKNNPPIYALTFRGCFLALGFNMSGKHLRQFIKNSAKHSLFFSYLNAITKETSLAIAKKVFINPIRELIKKGMIQLDDDFKLSIHTITGHCGREFQKFIEKNLNNKTIQDIENINKLSLDEGSDWYQEAVDKCFPSEDERKDYSEIYHDEKEEDDLLYYSLRRSMISAYEAVIS
tara:strand:+ start:4953 stop:5777 length:825 start_codon:yes stop_codon:yes gene_type:complete